MNLIHPDKIITAANLESLALEYLRQLPIPGVDIMVKLEDITIEELRNQLDEVDDPKASKRLLLEILYKQGASVPMIAEWYQIRDEIIYDWFSQIEDEPLNEAIFDDPPPVGRRSSPTTNANGSRTR